MSETFYVVAESDHNALVSAAYQHRGFNAAEAAAGARLCADAARHGIRTHNGIKALHLDHLFGSGSKGCVPNVEVEEKPTRFPAAKIWNANRQLGQATAYAALEEAIRLADTYGVGMVSVDNAFHYLWGGGYVMEAAKRGYVAYTNCTAALAEVVPFGGKFPTLGTNPHSWGLPTTEALGWPIVIDWATSVVSMGRVQQFIREGQSLPPNSAVDANGEPTTDPKEAKALLPFGAHKGYGLSLINELVGAFIGGSLPTIRNRWDQVGEGEKGTCCFFFQVWHPDAMSGGNFAAGRDQKQNVKAVLDDLLGHGNEGCMLPGQIEAQAAARSAEHGGLLFSKAEIDGFNELATEVGQPLWSIDKLKAI